MSDYTPPITFFRDRFAKEFVKEVDRLAAEAMFDRALAAHDAEVREHARHEFCDPRLGCVVAEEPEWEYGTRCPMRECKEPHLIERGDNPPQPEESVWRRTKARPAGPWVKHEGGESGG